MTGERAVQVSVGRAGRWADSQLITYARAPVPGGTSASSDGRGGWGDGGRPSRFAGPDILGEWGVELVINSLTLQLNSRPSIAVS